MDNFSFKQKMQEIKSWATGDIGLLQTLLPGGELIGKEFTAGSLNGERGNSLKYNIQTGIWADFATGEKGADILDLIKAVNKCTLSEAIEWLAKDKGYISGIRPNSEASNFNSKIKKKATITELIPAPLGIPAPTMVLVDGDAQPISDLWAYHDETGRVLMYDVRVDFTDGSKMVIPMHWSGTNWRNGTIPENRPLFNLHKIPDATKLIIVEGCKTASAVQQYFPHSTVVTWQGGTNAISKTDWTPIKNKERVIIIPDADCKEDPATKQTLSWNKQPGQKAALEIANILTKQGCNVFIVDTQGQARLKDGWDLADALATGWSKQKVLDLINEKIAPYKKDKSLSEITDLSIDDIKYDYSIAAEIKDQEDPKGFECDHYKVLGRVGKKYCFYIKASKAVMEYTSRELSIKSVLMEIAPLEYWESTFGEETKSGIRVCWEKVSNHLIQESQKAGLYDVQAVRGRGAWKDAGRTVINIGTSLIVVEPAKKEPYVVETHALDTRFVYETRPKINLPLRKPLAKEFSRKLIECCRCVRWEKPMYGDILAGWIFSSFIGGILPLRSHLYISGAQESGKSWVVKNIVSKIFGDYKLSVGGVSTEAGIRSALGCDSFPVIFDESEGEDQSDKERMQKIFNLARLAATNEGNNVAKGSANGGEALLYSIRSSFLFASINSSMTRDADISRTIKITIKEPPRVSASPEEKEQDARNFLKLEQYVSRLLTPEYCQALFSRAVYLCDNVERSVKVISQQAALVGGSKRFGDQMGMIIAGIWHLQNDAVIDESEAKRLIAMYKESKTDDMISYTLTEPLEWLALREISFIEDGLRKAYKLGELLDIMLDGMKDRSYMISTKMEEYSKKLGLQGIKIDDEYLYLSTTKSMFPSAQFASSIWGERGWIDTVLRIDGTEKTKANIYFSSLVRSQAIKIPLKSIVKEKDH